ncbi:N-terminal kinase-like protein [Scyliorhinus torazame]|uniref:N-terminal kinase-like protein n=1 Tax=Scyliorhinus torazame TaxID=75743 RepID=UPI003B5B1D9E
MTGSKVPSPIVSEWDSEGWGLEESWQPKEKAAAAPTPPRDDSWNTEWGDELIPSQTKTLTVKASASGPDVRFASEYNWDSTSGSGRQEDFFATVIQAPAVTQKSEDAWSADATAGWDTEDNWESVEAHPGLSKSDVSKKKREERKREMEAKRAERRAVKGPLKLGARKFD